MRKKSICLLLIFVLVSTFAMAGVTYATETKGDLEGDLAENQNEQNKISERLAEVESQINEKQPAVDKLNAEVSAANSRIVKTEKDISNKKQEMKNREDGLNERLRVMYKNGSVGFIDVLLGSNSISEFISNLEMIQRIYKNDREVLETLKKEEKELEELSKKLKEDKAVLDAKKAELDAEMKELNGLKAELEAAEDKLLEEAEALKDKIASITNPDSDYGGGAFVWPAPASRYVTSPFGWRIHPIYGTWKFHSGIDIGAAGGTNVLAAANGTVILSQWYGGYGNCIMIDHGGGIVTLYGHMSKRIASVGQKVSAGSVIGKVGSTGVSSGDHLHFEVQKGGEFMNPLDYVR